MRILDWPCLLFCFLFPFSLSVSRCSHVVVFVRVLCVLFLTFQYHGRGFAVTRGPGGGVEVSVSEAFITLKDHKDRFKNDLPCRLINPAKSELGIISKAILDRMVSAVRVATEINLWRSTGSVIDWFKGINDKSRHTFVCFDVVQYYPSIGEMLLIKALDFAATYTVIADEERNIVMHARKSVIFKDGQAWIKKGNGSMFDVTMGSFDGAEVCELVGAYLLNQLAEHIPKEQISLYCDDGLAIIKNASGGTAERLRKKLTAVFTANGLRVTIDPNLKVVDFLIWFCGK